MVRFMEIAGSQVNWQRWGTIGSRMCDPDFLQVLNCAFETLWVECPWGRARTILSHGAYVKKPGWHGTGQAIDITGILWKGQPAFECGKTEERGDWMRYVAIEATLRRFIPQVLGWGEKSLRHRHHWHADARPVGGFQAGSHVDVTFAQQSLNVAWLEDLAMDGKYGPKTQAAEARAMDIIGGDGFFDDTAWVEFLKLTARNCYDLFESAAKPVP